MSMIADLLDQRSRGEVLLRYGRTGVRDLRESGSSKLRLPRGSDEAILINTSGGLAGGDRIDVALAVESGARLAVTSQAAERIYRSLGPAAQIECRFDVAENATLHWLPQETIQFEGSKISRHIEAQVAPGAELLLVESFILGRSAMGEEIAHTEISDSWDIHCGGKLVHAERFRLGPVLPRGNAGLAKARAFATLLLISPDAEKRAAALAPLLAEMGAVSCWNGKLLARLTAEDGMKLRKALVLALAAATGGKGLPRVWSL